MVARGKVPVTTNRFQIILDKEPYMKMRTEERRLLFEVVASKGVNSIPKLNDHIFIEVKVEVDELIKDLNEILRYLRDEKAEMEQVEMEVIADPTLKKRDEYIDQLKTLSEFEVNQIQSMLSRFEEKIKRKIANGEIGETKGAYLLKILDEKLKTTTERKGTEIIDGKPEEVTDYIRNWTKDQYWIRNAIKSLEKGKHSEASEILQVCLDVTSKADKFGMEEPIGDFPKRIQRLDVTMREAILMSEEEIAIKLGIA